MIDSGEGKSADRFRPFEGMWLATNPSAAIVCAKVIKSRLLIPYSFGNPERLTGHHYDCQVVGEILYCRFENFDSANAGVMFLSVGPNYTLKGGRWANNQISEADRQDFSRWSESLPGMRPVVWIHCPKRETPHWAEKYFQEDWPNKF